MWSVIMIASAAALLIGSPEARSETPSMPVAKEQRIAAVQAAIIYQLTKYIQWDVTGHENLALCIHAGPVLSEELERLIEKTTSGKRLRLSEPPLCDLIYVPQNLLREYEPMMASHKHRQVLTVSDAPGFIDMGGMVSLVDRQGRVGIEINLQMLHAEGFTVSLPLIEIAERVIK